MSGSPGANPEPPRSPQSPFHQHFTTQKHENPFDYQNQREEISPRDSMIAARWKLRGKLLLALLRTKYSAEVCGVTRTWVQ